MFAAGIVEAIDVVKESVAYVDAGLPCMPPDQFSFRGFEEGLDGGIVVTVSSAIH